MSIALRPLVLSYSKGMLSLKIKKLRYYCMLQYIKLLYIGQMWSMINVAWPAIPTSSLQDSGLAAAWIQTGMELLLFVWSIALGTQMANVKVIVHEDPDLGFGPDEDDSESDSRDDSDSGSILSDDSVLPDYKLEDNMEGTVNTLYQACAKNHTSSLCKMLEQGVTQEQVMELDINGRVGVQMPFKS